MNEIKNQLVELERNYNTLKSLLEENFKIDDKIPSEDEILSILNNNQEITKEINTFFKDI